MRRWKLFIGLAILTGLVIWFFDAILDSILLAEQPFLDTLLLDVHEYDVFHRLIIWGLTCGLLFLLLRFQESVRKTKEVIKTERDKAQKYLDVAGAMLVVIGPDQKVQLINSRGCEILGYSEEEIVGKNWFDNFLPQAIRKQVKAIFDQLMAGDVEPEEYFENPVLTRNGEERVIAWHNSILKNNGDIICILSSGSDITERKRAEELLRQSEEKYRFLYEDSPSINLLIGVDGKIIDTNAAALKVVGYSPDEIRGRDVLELIVEEDRELSTELMEKSYQGEDTPDVDLRIIAKDGSIRTVLFSQGNVVLRENDQPTGILVTGIDITERKRAEEALVDSERQYRFLVENTYDMFYRVNLHDESYDYLSPAVEKNLGYEIAEFIEMAKTGELEKRIHPDDLTMLKEDAEALRDSGRGALEKPVIEYRLRHKDGDYRWISDARKVVFDEAGKATTIIGMSRDITERKRAEEKIKTALREKEVLLQEVHHRVKNNLQIITSLLSLEAGKQTDERTISALRDSRNRIKTMAHIHEMLYQSKDLGRIDLTRYLNDVVSSIFSSYTTDLSSVDFELEIDNVYLGIDTAIPLGLIINELVSNSIKHAFPNGRAGRVRIGFYEKENSRFTLCVSDNGRGLPAGFDIGGTKTLGLQLVSMMVEQLNGELEIARRDGTAFSVTFQV